MPRRLARVPASTVPVHQTREIGDDGAAETACRYRKPKDGPGPPETAQVAPPASAPVKATGLAPARGRKASPLVDHMGVEGRHLRATTTAGA